MADEEKPVDLSHTRKTVSFTHRQLGWSGGILGALAIVSQLKGAFITREEGNATVQRVTTTEAAIIAMKTELNSTIEKSTSRIIDQIKESESRSSRNADRQERRLDRMDNRMDGLEVASRLFKPKKSDN